MFRIAREPGPAYVAPGIIDPVPARALLRTRLLAAAAALATALSGCSGGDGRPLPGDAGDAGGTAPPSASATADPAARTGSPPEFHGERGLAVQAGRRVFVQPSCTPDADGMRLCWGETADPLERDGSPRPVTLTDAVMRLDDLGLDWSVRLTFAEAAPLTGTASAASGEDGRVLLLTEEADLLRQLPSDAVTGRVVTLPGLEKAEAWDLVELVGDVRG